MPLAPGLIRQRPKARPAPPSAAAIDVAGFVGLAERGPLDRAVALDGWPAFVASFGAFLPGAHLAYAVRGFFENGGRRCLVVRIAAATVESELDLAAAQPADRRSSVVTTTDGLAAGALVTMRQNALTATAGAQPADRLSSAVTDARGFAEHDVVVLRQTGAAVRFARVRRQDLAGSRLEWMAPLDQALDLTKSIVLEARRVDQRIAAVAAAQQITWQRPLDPRFDLGLPIAFAAGAAPATAILPDEDGLPLIRVEASSAGIWGNRLQVSVARATVTGTASVRKPAPDAPAWLTVDRVSELPVGATVTLRQDGAPAVRRLIAAVGPRERRLFWDTPLPAAFDLAAAADGSKPISVHRLGFTLSVSEGGRLVEVFERLSLPAVGDPQDSPVNHQSALIRLTRLAPLGAAAYPLPDPTSPLLERGVARLAEGRDGTAMLSAADFIGDDTAPVRRGLRVFELEEEPGVLAIPDALIDPSPARDTAPPVPPTPDPCALTTTGAAEPEAAPPATEPVEAMPAISDLTVALVQQALVVHCENRRDRIALLDPPRPRDLPDRDALEPLISWRERFDSSFAAAYAPWLLVADPLAAANGGLRAVPPSGHLAGQFAQTDAGTGVQSAPANRPLVWVAAVARALAGADQERLNPLGLNAIRSFPGRGIRPYGARLLTTDPAWRYLNVRRLIIAIEKGLAQALAWTVFEPNSPRFQAFVVSQIDAFLAELWQRRRLAGRRPEEAYYVTPVAVPGAADRGQFIIEIGVAPVIPAEFVVLRLARSIDRLEFAEVTEATGCL
ncbi:MAG: hypothetical protein GC191_00930 [Azospirillum sp.]|nr:hypothetical protein [Azospirillum sp.]